MSQKSQKKKSAKTALNSELYVQNTVHESQKEWVFWLTAAAVSVTATVDLPAVAIRVHTVGAVLSPGWRPAASEPLGGPFLPPWNTVLRQFPERWIRCGHSSLFSSFPIQRLSSKTAVWSVLIIVGF